jgi:hypothetical protein
MNNSYCSYNEINQGVDLNRNYDFHFGGNPEDYDICGETYNGPKAFSEPETSAIRDLLIKYPKIKSAMNFHSYGNMWVRPFNFSKNKNLFKSNMLKEEEIKIYDFFEKIIKNVTPSALYGNAISMVNYVSYGEASDYMLGKHGIISFSPELGSGK